MTITENQLTDPLTRRRDWPNATLTVRPTQIYYAEYVENPAFTQQPDGDRTIYYGNYIDVAAGGGLTKKVTIGSREMPALQLIRCPP